MSRVPNSGGTARPRHATPAGAADCHVHVYDARFPMMHPAHRATPEATVADYRLLRERLGTSRVVVVQPAAYGTDNRVTVDAVAQLGPDVARGVAVVHPDIGEAALAALDAGGVRGLRFTQHEPRTAVTTPEMIEPLARRIQAHGWHTQLHLRGDQLLAMAGIVERLPGTVVIDHMGRVPLPEGTAHAAFDRVRRWLDTGRFWVKLTGPYLESRTGAPDYADCAAIARGYLAHAPQRCVWGSDWPHPTEAAAKPDDARLMDLLAQWAAPEDLRRQVLVDNPAILYGFPQ